MFGVGNFFFEFLFVVIEGVEFVMGDEVFGVGFGYERCMFCC